MSFSKILNHWYSNNKRELPWRQTINPYFIWLSEIILQQTQVKQGLPYYQSFTKAFPTVFDLANASESDVLKLWQGLGYYSRARNLHASAKYIVDELQGEFPNNYKDLLHLKGVGDYTASAIASICFNEVSAVVDGNVYRVLSRYFGIDTPINSSKGFREFKELAQQLIDKKNPSDFNQAIMEFGAVQCKPQNPECNRCPFQKSCIAIKDKRVSELPVKIKPIKASVKYFNFLVIISRDQKTVLEKRIGKGIWQNLYQFPLVESLKDIGIEQMTELIEKNDFVRNFDFALNLYNDKPIIHKLSHQHLHTKFWIITMDSHLDKGIDFIDIHNYPVPTLIENFIKDFNF